MIRFEPITNHSNPWHYGGIAEVETLKELEEFFVYWYNNPFKKRIFIEDNLIKFQYTDLMYSQVLTLGRILDK